MAPACNGASATSSDSSGAVSIIKSLQSFAEYTHCTNHVLNLAIIFADKNESIKKYLNN